jgi:hypothetical protein
MARPSRPRTHRSATLIAALLGGAVVSLAPSTPAAASLDEWLDPSYGGSALAVYDGRSAVSNADAQDRVYIATNERNTGDLVNVLLRRLTSSGAVDPTFGGGQVALATGVESAEFVVRALHADAAGALTVVTNEHNGISSGWDTVVRRYTGMGELDTSFGTAGQVSLEADVSNVPYFYGLAARPGGGYFVAFADNDIHGDSSSFIAALTETGDLDASWAPTAPIPGLLPVESAFTIHDIAVDGDKLLLLGVHVLSAENRPSELRRLTAAGAADQSFASAGVLAIPGSPSMYTAMTVRNGVYYVAGTDYTLSQGAGAQMLVGKVLGSGQLDGTFGVNGVARGLPGSCVSFPQHIFVSDVGITVQATTGCAGTFLRFDLSGAQDRTYGDEGAVVIRSFGDHPVLSAGAATTQADGRIVGLLIQSDGGLAVRPFRLTETRPAPLPGSFVPLPPSRILDTRNGNGVPAAGAVPAGGSVQLSVTGRGGVPASGVGAVVLNLTVTQPSAAGYVTAYPTGETPPMASNLNFSPGQTIANLVTVKLGPDGTVTLRNGTPGTVQLIADVAGYYHAGTATEPGTFTPLTPARILDTRAGTGIPAPATVPGRGTVQLTVTGHGGVPASGVSAVVLNLTVTQPNAAGYITAYPTGESRPAASNLNFSTGQTIANLVTVKLGTNGQLTLYNGAPASTHLIADVAGYYLAGTATAHGTFVPLTPARILDTRSGTGTPGGVAAPISSGASIPLQIDANGGVPQAWVGAAILNLTATGATADGVAVIYPSDVPAPLASNLNFTAGTDIANLAITKDGTNGQVRLRSTSPGGTAHYVVDVFGYFKS